MIKVASLTKNKADPRDPYMHPPNKGNQWFFDLKAHIGFDAKRDLVHSFTTISVNEHNLNQPPELTHGEENINKRWDWLITDMPREMRV